MKNRFNCLEYVSRLPIEIRNANQKDLNQIESEKTEPFWGYYQKYSPEWLLLQFKDRKTFTKQWDFIPFEQYHNLLKRYMEDPIRARIPDNLVSDWIIIIYKNLAQIVSINQLFGRGIEFPYEIVEKFYNIEPDEDCEKRLINCMNTLSFSGFYGWTTLPTNWPAWNDRGFIKVYTILKQYREDMDPGDKLILIDRCLNVIHGRDNMAKYFIEGGKESLNKIRDL